MINKLIFQCVFAMQKILLHVSYWICKSKVENEKDLWVVGVDETANIVFNVATVFEKVYSVNFLVHKFYGANHYNYNLGKKSPLQALAIRTFCGPLLLGYLAARAYNL